jgi:hypothetical protein
MLASRVPVSADNQADAVYVRLTLRRRSTYATGAFAAEGLAVYFIATGASALAGDSAMADDSALASDSAPAEDSTADAIAVAVDAPDAST